MTLRVRKPLDVPAIAQNSLSPGMENILNGPLSRESRRERNGSLRGFLVPSKVALCSPRTVVRLPVKVQVPAMGSNNSAVFDPPATSTLPSVSSVAVWVIRGLLRWPVGVHTWVSGSYSSALFRTLSPSDDPPTISTLPSCSKVAVWYLRAVWSRPVANHSPAAGLYNSTLSKESIDLSPPC